MGVDDVEGGDGDEQVEEDLGVGGEVDLEEGVVDDDLHGVDHSPELGQRAGSKGVSRILTKIYSL